MNKIPEPTPYHSEHFLMEIAEYVACWSAWQTQRDGTRPTNEEVQTKVRSIIAGTDAEKSPSFSPPLWVPARHIEPPEFVWMVVDGALFDGAGSRPIPGRWDNQKRAWYIDWDSSHPDAGLRINSGVLYWRNRVVVDSQP